MERPCISTVMDILDWAGSMCLRQDFKDGTWGEPENLAPGIGKLWKGQQLDRHAKRGNRDVCDVARRQSARFLAVHIARSCSTN